jgi:hypothetical protein
MTLIARCCDRYVVRVETHLLAGQVERGVNAVPALVSPQ